MHGSMKKLMRRSEACVTGVVEIDGVLGKCVVSLKSVIAVK